MPPHQTYDCVIELLTGASIHLKREVMEKYIAVGIIRPASSPLGACFFFVEKKDKTLCIIINYRGMNSTTVTNKYPLRVMYPVLETPQEAQILTKLDLNNLV